MGLKRVLDSLDGLDEALHGLYTEKDGKYHLDVEGDPAPAADGDKLKEFRERNTALSKQKRELEDKIADLNNKFKGVDMDAFRRGQAALKRIQDDQEREMIASGDIEGVLQLRTTAMQEQHKEALDAMTAARDKAVAQASTHRESLAKYEIDDAIFTELKAIGARPLDTARADIGNRGRQSFSVGEDGKLATDKYGPDGGKLTPRHFAEDLVKSAGHLFESAGGAGSGGSDDNNNPRTPLSGPKTPEEGTKANPFILKNPTSHQFGKYAEYIADGRVKVES